MDDQKIFKIHEARKALEAREWLGTLGDQATMAGAWEKCQRPNWMLWALNASNCRPDDAMLRKLACAFIRRTPLADGRTVWDLLDDERSRNAVDVAERYSEGKATQEELDAARAAAGDAAGDAQCAIIREFIKCPWD